MDEREFALITLAISGLFGLAVAVTTNWMTAGRENRTFRRQLRRERIEAARTLYEDALSALETLIVSRARTDKAGQAEFTRLLARLALRSTDEIRTQFDKTAEAALDWAAQYRKSQPEEMAGLLVYKSGASKYEEEAEKLYPIFHAHFFKLKGMMVEHLKELEAQGT
jgi:uncharacterized protein with PIN domain